MRILLLAAAAFLVSACNEQTQPTQQAETAAVVKPAKTYSLTLAQTWPSSLPVLTDTTKRFAAMAEQMSAGRLKVRVDASNKHKAPLGIFDLVKSGQYDLGHSASYYWKGKDVNTLFFTTMPFGMIAAEQNAWFEYGGGQELMNKVYGRHGLLAVPGGNTGNQMGGWFKKEINTPEDLHGLKMRIPGFAGEIMAKVGAKPTNIAPGELYTSLERKTIDALEWIGPAFDLSMGFHKIAPYYYTSWHEPGAESQFLVNKKKLASLPEDLQAILLSAMKLSGYQTLTQVTFKNGENWKIMKEEYPSIQIKTFPAPVMAVLKKANDELLAEMAAKDPLSKEIIESQQAFLKTSRQWTKISDQAFLNSNEDLVK
ncbi:TRAP transporter substrate-binding protein [Pelagibaculum spongiae]|uniref:ABC transporter substrate-binding protein n=1 Tax=Pelagibaculum spongiae TaxID=2080658 RepID=A0A2V1GRI5_9GAMM|nr:TRAP transporter substrate-binding protein [Pelagibaculum spongiae]PVZ63919.1 ABC transporter substrate-binding protein [Pelagibaculum spongiae]